MIVVFAIFLIILTGCCNKDEEPTIRTVYLQTSVSELEMSVYEEYHPAKRPMRSSNSNKTIRYTIRAYPINNGTIASYYSNEFTFIRNWADGDEHTFALPLATGKHAILIWADLSPDNSTYLYDISDFQNVTIAEQHVGNTDYRDAFRGYVECFVETHKPDTTHVEMTRPLAKFECITTDIDDFLNENSSTINLEDYKVVLNYIGYMPNSYNMFTDKPNGALMGVQFDSQITQINAHEGSLGYDYVFVHRISGSVTIRLSIYNKDNTLLATSADIVVPLKRNQHTIIRGNFLTSNTTGGVTINPEYDDDYNILLP